MSAECCILLRAARNGAAIADNAEDGFARIRAITGNMLDNTSLAEAVAECLLRKLIRDPVRLPAGALQCHWTLELTPKGVEAARGLLAQRKM